MTHCKGGIEDCNVIHSSQLCQLWPSSQSHQAINKKPGSKCSFHQFHKVYINILILIIQENEDEKDKVVQYYIIKLKEERVGEGRKVGREKEGVEPSWTNNEVIPCEKGGLIQFYKPSVPIKRRVLREGGRDGGK